jgi:hypothetical protein
MTTARSEATRREFIKTCALGAVGGMVAIGFPAVLRGAADNTAAPAVYDLGTVQVEVGQPMVINQSDTQRCWFPNLLAHIGERKLVLVHGTGADQIEPTEGATDGTGGGLGNCFVTEDGGHTWSKPLIRPEFPNPWIRLRDGTFLGIGAGYPDYVNEQTASFRIAASRNGLDYDTSSATVDASPHKFTRGAQGTKKWCGMVFCRSMIEALDGSLLANLYGRFKGDALDRSALVRSTDRGKSWEYYSTIGYDPTGGGEGLNEPCMVRLANQSLFCFMRNESGRPMFRSRSTDDGKTWSKPDRMPGKYASMSVQPDLTLMRSGILACSAGRPKCQLVFCTDSDGTSWTNPITIFAGPSTGYTSLREVAPDTLLYVHDVTPAGWEKPQPGKFHQILGRFVTVKRKGGSS